MNKLLKKIINLFFPAKCILCAKVLDTDTADLCADCLAAVKQYPHKQIKLPHIADWIALWYYEENVRDSLLRFKFYGRSGYAAVYGRLLAEKILKEDIRADILTWVPISARRKRSRGYDQVELIADAVGKTLGMPPARILKKIRHTKPQSRLKLAAQRRANVLGSYQVLFPQLIAGKRILLLDDIITTGATAGECARMLLTAGAKEVICATVAAASYQNK